jgi:phage shock protein PspC (stress-responsive transcriptional regulator)
MTKLTKDVTNSKIGGVCAGIGNTMEIDPTIIRIAFVLSFLIFGTGLLLYIVLWALLPKN